MVMYPWSLLQRVPSNAFNISNINMEIAYGLILEMDVYRFMSKLMNSFIFGQSEDIFYISSNFQPPARL